MTITVTPSSAVTAGVVGQVDASASDTSGLFANLLGVQLGSRAGTLLGASKDSGKTQLKDQDSKDSTASDNSNAANSLFLQGMPVVLPQQYVNQPIDVAKGNGDAALLSASSVNEGKADALALLTGAGKKAAPKALDEQNLPQDDKAFMQFLPVQAQASAPTAASNQASAVKTLMIQEPITDPNWTKSMSEQMLSMVSMKAEKAHIQINPPQLGPIDISLKMNGTDQAQVVFAAAVPATREMLESNMPKLATMLAAGGIQLTGAQVSSGQSGQQQSHFAQQQNSRQQQNSSSEEVDALTAIKAARGVLSIFV
ncbi:MAG TPA: flagellar hook-length control protein FliK [Chromobacteriaceae bacterium]|nr:flagellar hook-length control protein FliK [Chromobacteriaceae bacterium]